jgi:heme oxygenase
MAPITQQQLREACKNLHDLAEITPLAQALITGTIKQGAYKQLCYQLGLIARAIESRYDLGYLELRRSQALAADVAACQGDVTSLTSTKEYLDLLAVTPTDQLRGHVYVHYMGWLYGGQMIAKKLSLPINHLQFDNVRACVDHMRNTILV